MFDELFHVEPFVTAYAGDELHHVTVGSQLLHTSHLRATLETLPSTSVTVTCPSSVVLGQVVLTGDGLVQDVVLVHGDLRTLRTLLLLQEGVRTEQLLRWSGRPDLRRVHVLLIRAILQVPLGSVVTCDLLVGELIFESSQLLLQILYLLVQFLVLVLQVETFLLLRQELPFGLTFLSFNLDEHHLLIVVLQFEEAL